MARRRNKPRNQNPKLEPPKSNPPENSDQQQFWLLKTEPSEWSWEDQSANGGKSKWDGVKNKQAQKHLNSMRIGDLCFFYHSGAKARRAIGVVRVVRECYADGDDGGVAVDVEAVGELRRPVDLAEMKGDERLRGSSGFGLFRQPRLSVVPVPAEVGRGCANWAAGLKGTAAERWKRRRSEGFWVAHQVFVKMPQ